MKIPAWLKRYAPAIFARIAEYLAKRRAEKIARLLVATVGIVALGNCKTIEQKLCPSDTQLCLDEHPGADGSYFRCAPRGEPCHQPPQTIPSPSPSPEPSPAPSPSETPEPSPSPVPSPGPIVPTPGTPVPSPSPSPKPCKVDEANLPCWTCSARLAYDVAHGHLKWDPALKLYFNDPPGKPREYFDRQCNKTDAAGTVRVRAHDWYGTYPATAQGLCPVEMLTCPSPSPSPSPTNSPEIPDSSPSPPLPGPGNPPPLDNTGNYPIPPAGTCPWWFGDSLARVGIQEHARRSCGQCVRDGYLGIIITASATPKSVPPYCGHASDRRECEQWRPCQDGYTDWTNPNLGPDLLMTLPGHWTDARCDKRSDNNYLCHHRPRKEETGTMTFKACPRGASPSDPRCGVSRPVGVP